MRWLLLLTAVSCGGAQLQTGADGCYYLATDICKRGQSCGLMGDLTNCINNATSVCCSNNDCSKPIRNPALVTNCGDEFTAESCGDVVGNLVPNACVGVIAKSQQ